MQPTSISARRRKKVSNACKSCRNRKLRCSGRYPCERCSGRSEPCIYEEKERRLVVSADHLTRLRDRIQSLESQLDSSSRDRRPLDGGGGGGAAAAALSPEEASGNEEGDARSGHGSAQSNVEEETSSRLTNTLVTSEPPIKIRRHGHAAYLGHSSTLSFSRNVRNILVASRHVADLGGVSIEREDVSYITPLPPIALDLKKIPLPRLAYAEYLTNTVDLYLGSLYSLFSTTAFLSELRAFYAEREAGVTTEPGLWHIQMLLVLGLGKSMVTREHSDSGPAGMVYFTSAIEAIPDTRRLYQDPFLSIEILCLAALFMLATDMLQESYVTIGNALRIATTKIMNISIPESLHPPNVEYQRRLLWTVYCIDRKNAAMLGSTMVVRDEDISIPFPKINPGDEAQTVFSIHVRLSSHLGKILNVIYGAHSQKQRTFMVEVKGILERLVETLVVLRQHLDLQLGGSFMAIPREAATLHLLLHQCVILTVRPVLYSMLKSLFNANTPDGRSPKTSPIFDSMLKMCVESAVEVLNITSALKHHMMCDIFLPYDIDALFSAANALILIDIIRPANELLWDLPQVMQLLDEYVARHVAPAQAYRSDLQQLLELHTKIRAAENAAPNMRPDDEPPVNSGNRGALDSHANNAAPATVGSPSDPVWSQIRPGDETLAPSNLQTMISVIDDLNTHDLEVSDDGLPDLGWMWEHDDFWALPPT